MQQPKAKKSLGQNFLQDKNIARKIVGALGVQPHDHVLEIGPGPGMLTGFLLEAAPASLTLVEKDDYWAAEHANKARDCALPLRVITGDALRQDWPSYSTPVKIAGNLPYNIASPLMWDIVSQASGLTRAVFMVQKEVAQRVAALPSTSAYGALSVWMQNFCKPRLEFLVPPQVFLPRPKVWSAVISLEPLPAEDKPAHPEKLAYLLKILFQQRRKQMGTVLRAHGHDALLLERHGVSPMDRIENIPPLLCRSLSELF